jgi:hypothetical protein
MKELSPLLHAHGLAEASLISFPAAPTRRFLFCAIFFLRDFCLFCVPTCAPA